MKEQRISEGEGQQQSGSRTALPIPLSGPCSSPFGGKKMVGLGEESGEGTVVRFGYQLPIRKQAGFWPKERGGGKCPGNLQAHVKARATCKPRKRSECKRPPRQVQYCSCHTTATPSTILIQKMVGNRECWGGGRDPCVGASFLLRRMWACRVEGYEREVSTPVPCRWVPRGRGGGGGGGGRAVVEANPFPGLRSPHSCLARARLRACVCV